MTPATAPSCRAGWRDAVLLALLAALLALAACAIRHMLAPLDGGQPALSLDPGALPLYALRSTARMLLAMAASLLFALVYATAAAKSRHAEKVLIPLLDILQSVPILGYLSATAAFFVALAPHTYLGAELASVFAIFTSQAWNMAFSFYQALRTVPHDLDEVCQGFRLSAWQRFWRLEFPFAVPGLLWNAMMSMSGGWFFVVASEAIAVGTLRIDLPGIGSYAAKATRLGDLHAIGYAIGAMLLTILAYDQLLFRPLAAWADKYRYEQTAAQAAPRSWLNALYRRAGPVRALGERGAAWAQAIGGARLALPGTLSRLAAKPAVQKLCGRLFYLATLTALIWLVAAAYGKVAGKLGLEDVAAALRGGLLTLVRVALLVTVASLVWVPAGVLIGLRPRLAEKVQPLIQFLAAFPVNLLYPVFVLLIVRYQLSPVWWLSPLMIFGTQWYILFNVIAGATAFPGDFREAAAVFHIRRWRWWRQVMLPGIFPYYVTGAITASGGSWNASIVAEWVSWGATTLDGGGLGAYIARMTQAGDFARIALGVAVMSLMVVIMNRALWRPLHAFAERRTRLD